MQRKIIWSEEAVQDYSSNIDYLLQAWSVKEAQEFVDKTTLIISIIVKLPEAFPLSDYKKVRKALVCRQINMLYIVQQTEIIILRFWDNRQQPEK